MTNVASVRAELAAVDGELLRLDGRRHELLARRAHLVSLLTHASAAPPPRAGHGPGRPATPPAVGPAVRATARPAARPREVAPKGAQNVLLTLGGTLLAIAAIAFTVVSWGALGEGGRAAVLSLVTLAALAVPALLVRRGLVATARTVSVLALILTVLDTVQVSVLAQPSNGFAFAGGAALVLTAVWTAYGLVVGELGIPLPAAVLAGQFVPLLWALAAGAAPLGLAGALLATGVADAAVALRVRRSSVWIPAALAAAGTGGWGMFGAWWFSVSAPTAAHAVAPGLLLLAGAAAVVSAALRERRLAPAAAIVATLSTVAAVGDVARHAVPADGAVAVYLACALAAAGTARGPLPRGAARAVAATAAGLTACCVLWVLPVPALVLASALAGYVWSGGGLALPVAAAPLVLAVTAALPLCAGRWLLAAPRPGADGPAPRARVRHAAAGGVTTALGLAAVAALPATLGLGFAATVALLLALVAALLVVAARPGPVGAPTAVTAAVGAGLCAAPVVALSTSARWSLLLCLGVLTALLAALAALGGAHSRRAPLGVRAVLGCLAVVCATAFTAAVPATAGRPAATVASAVLLVPALVAVLAAWPGVRPALVGVPVEATGAAAAVVPVVYAAAAGPRVLAVVLAVCALIAAGTALRPVRRGAGTCAAAVLLVASLWVWLAQAGVSAPEAYTVPVALPLLAVGAVRRRSERTASSWVAYGPGLALALVPALGASWVDAHWPRPLLLGLAALAVTLAGGRRRLLAPLLLGGGVLALDALHELAPYVVQVAGLVPRWVPMALAGLLLLGLGATYEQRLRDARRLREVLGGMR
ncbi:SCO7613 C-terminal domain-containing membrane protein [Streptomyces sp. NBC_01497]|uniref:SCO7613 C-terminal domain-containing membrane protein n=1 Tax=Streptomyces sp. NBC_01497 TaxID=2903885 RepID=UPI002E346F9F|nr:hypothetical protein [Streptomyces sp. NBC_01497]